MFTKDDLNNFYQEAFILSGNKQQSYELLQIALEQHLQNADIKSRNGETILSTIRETYQNYFKPEQIDPDFTALTEDQLDELMKRQKDAFKNQFADIGHFEKFKTSLTKQRSVLNRRIFMVLFAIMVVTVVNRRMQRDPEVQKITDKISKIYTSSHSLDLTTNNFEHFKKANLPFSPIDLKPKNVTLKGLSFIDFYEIKSLMLVYENNDGQKILVLQTPFRNTKIYNKLLSEGKIKTDNIEMTFIKKNNFLIGLTAPLF